MPAFHPARGVIDGAIQWVKGVIGRYESISTRRRAWSSTAPVCRVTAVGWGAGNSTGNSVSGRPPRLLLPHADPAPVAGALPPDAQCPSGVLEALRQTRAGARVAREPASPLQRHPVPLDADPIRGRRSAHARRRLSPRARRGAFEVARLGQGSTREAGSDD